MFDGLSVGGADNKSPRAEKQKAAKSVAIIRDKVMIFIPNKNTPISKIKADMKMPNRKEAVMSPNMIAHNAMGAETSLSNVLMRVSHGAIMGEMAEEVKKSPIDKRPGNRKLVDRFLPTAKAIKRKDGRSKPKTITGPFI